MFFVGKIPGGMMYGKEGKGASQVIAEPRCRNKRNRKENQVANIGKHFNVKKEIIIVTFK